MEQTPTPPSEPPPTTTTPPLSTTSSSTSPEQPQQSQSQPLSTTASTSSLQPLPPFVNPNPKHPSPPVSQQLQSQSLNPMIRTPFNRPWQQNTTPFPHFSSMTNNSTASSSSLTSIPPTQRGGMAIGVPAHGPSPQTPTSFSSLTPPSFGSQFGGLGRPSSVNVPESVPSTSTPQVRQSISGMQGMGMMGSLGSSSSLRPSGVTASHPPRPLQSSLRPQTGANNQSVAAQNFQEHGLLRLPSTGSPGSPAPSTSQSSQTHNQRWLSSGSQGKRPLPPPSFRPQMSSQSLQQRSPIPSQQQSTVSTSTQQPQTSSSSQPQSSSLSQLPPEHYSLPSSRVPQTLTHQQQMARNRGVGNQRPFTPALGQSSSVAPPPMFNRAVAVVEASESCNRIISKRSIQEIVAQIFKIKAPDVFIVQNPPSVPTLVAVKWASWLRQSSFIIDWHNFGYTLLALSLGRSSRFVVVYHWVELHFGNMANGSLCVTKAMQHELEQVWGIKATVLYDQPPEFFCPTHLEEKHKLFCRIKKDMFQSNGPLDCISYGITSNAIQDPNTTLFTNRIGDDYHLKQNRPALIVSSTSWTPDEDFGILLEAAVMYDRRVAALLNENDSNGEEVLWKAIDDGKTFSYPSILNTMKGKDLRYKDGACRVALGASGNGDMIIATPNTIEVVARRKSDKIKIMGGAQRRATGKLIGVDGTDGIVKVDDSLDVMILDMYSKFGIVKVDDSSQVSTIDPAERLDPEVEDILVYIADELVESVTTLACSLAKHRKSNTLESKDILLHLEKNWNMNLPGFGGDEIKCYKKPFANDFHRERVAAIKKSVAAAETPNSKSLGGQAGGGAKGHPAKAPGLAISSSNPKVREAT